MYRVFQLSPRRRANTKSSNPLPGEGQIPNLPTLSQERAKQQNFQPSPLGRGAGVRGRLPLFRVCFRQFQNRTTTGVKLGGA